MRNLSFLFLFALLLAGCGPKPEADEVEFTCDVVTILLDESFFPGEVQTKLTDSPIPDAPPQSAERMFRVETETSVDIIQQDIMSFGSVSRASDFYKAREKWSFKTDAYKGPWQTPESLLDYSFAADQFHAGCGQDLSEEICQWLARYNGVYVHFQSIISEKGMTVEVFVDAVKEIDARMIRCIEN